MTTIASGALVEARLVAESTFGVTPASPTMKQLRHSGFNFNPKKATFESAEVRPDRQIADFRHGMRSVDGQIAQEMGVGFSTDLLEGALASTWGTVTTGSTSLSVSSTSEFTRASGSFVTDGFLVGDEIASSGFVVSGNNGRFKVVSVTALNLTVISVTKVNGIATVNSTPLTDDVAASGRTICVGATTVSPGKRLKLGTTMKSYSLERGFTDISEWELYTGVIVDGFDLAAKPSGINTLTFTLKGANFSASGSSAASVVTAPDTNAPLDGLNGWLFEGDAFTAALGVVTSVDIKLANNRSIPGVLGQNTGAFPAEGRGVVTGKLSVYFEDLTLFEKFDQETETALDLYFPDINGVDFLHVRMPRIKLNSGTSNPPKDGPIVMDMDFQALLDSVSGTTLIINSSI